LHERLDAQREQIATVEKNLSAQISREVGDLSDLIGDPIIPKLDQHEDRLAHHDTDIAELQKAVDLKPRQQ
jgi:hypothetical protein